jgi:chromosome transmission fidelity protein 4
VHLRCDAGAARTLWPAAQVLRTLKVGPYTRGLAYDPEGEYIASVSADGCLQVWHTSGKAELRLPRTAPKARAPAHTPAPRSLPCAACEAGRRVQVDTASAARSAPDWNPDGSLLAVPGCDNDVTLFERLSWEPVFSLAGQHSAPVNAVSFSPDGACCAPALSRI